MAGRWRIAGACALPFRGWQGSSATGRIPALGPAG
jgi:hypothetical protein